MAVIEATVKRKGRAVTRKERRRARERQIAAARQYNMRHLLRALYGRGVTSCRKNDGAVFCVMPITRTGAESWDCGAIEVEGKWVGGSARLRQAVEVLQP